MPISLTLGLAAGLALFSFGVLLPQNAQAAPAKPTGVLSYTVQDIDGKSVPLSRYAGKVLLIVNTASLCGNTPQYASLEQLYETYKGRGLRILAFPANDFGSQEPGTNGEIHQFCTGKYKTTFDLFSKISVKAPHQAPLYTFLTSKDTDPQFGGDIEWNFAKFLIDRNGKVVAPLPCRPRPPLTRCRRGGGNRTEKACARKVAGMLFGCHLVVKCGKIFGRR